MMKELNKNSLEKYAADGKMVLVEAGHKRMCEALARGEKIEVVPTLVLYKNGQAVDSIAGPGSKAAVEAFIQKNS